ncbi:MAG: YihA family ribosome biogenesis GTP-binding protein [Rhizobiales bacterium]|nr:YihA family ribosome biogenesis GTP-binding protein [Hyphomicrobiales bacterium]
MTVSAFDAETLAAADRAFARPCTFVKGVVDAAGLPAPDRPEVAFAGRSNVGKSSLLNAVVGRRNLARSSSTPGRTQEINYFDLAGQLYLVDLPGYGFAEAPKSKVDAWNRLIRDYLRGRVGLRRVFLLIDARHGMKPIDREIAKLLDGAAVPFQAVLTKADKLRGDALDKVVKSVAQALLPHPAAFPRFAVTSAEKGLGISEVRAEIIEAAGL